MHTNWALTIGALASLMLSGSLSPAVTAAEAPSPHGALLSRVAAQPRGAATVVTIDTTVGVPAKIETRRDPDRILVEMAGVASAQTVGVTNCVSGLVVRCKVATSPEGVLQVSIETRGPVAVASATMAPVAGRDGAQPGVRLTVQLTRPSPPDPFSELLPVDPSLPRDGAAPRQKPLVMIDPGHGGIDPGAIGTHQTLEKAVVLAVALQFADQLRNSGRYSVQLTRTSDIFVPLDIRLDLAQQAQPDLFVSLHADTIDDAPTAAQVRGASVYVLSAQASNEEAQRMAEKENAADLVAGGAIPARDASGDIKPILFDLTARETAALSRLASSSVITAFRRKHALTREPERAAAFRVLRQPSAPAVLVELGFLSHPVEERLMGEPQWQRQIATSLKTAVDSFFANKERALALGGGATSAPGGLPP